MQFCTVKCYELRGKLQEKIPGVVWLLSQVNKRIFFILLKKYIWYWKYKIQSNFPSGWIVSETISFYQVTSNNIRYSCEGMDTIPVILITDFDIYNIYTVPAQYFPVNPCAHWQGALDLSSRHLPLLRQGLGRQTFFTARKYNKLE